MRPFSLLVKPAGADCNLQCAHAQPIPDDAAAKELAAGKLPTRLHALANRVLPGWRDVQVGNTCC